RRPCRFLFSRISRRRAADARRQGQAARGIDRKRASAAPDIPSVAEATGIADFDFALWVGFFWPPALSMDITKRLNAAINQILLEPEVKTRLQNDGAEVSALSIDEFSGFVRAEIAKYQGIIAAANIKPE